ncbi:MAG: hypothetical protein HKN85_09950 [Gammaproteobacteria bacterium]|nr:hypothetical protein [Gammaproteobacteria bacterium]
MNACRISSKYVFPSLLLYFTFGYGVADAQEINYDTVEQIFNALEADPDAARTD